MEHTKTPWEVYTGHDGQFKGEPYIAPTMERGVIGYCNGRIPEVNHANAQFIVKAVNNYDKLIKGLQDLLDYIDDDDSYGATIIRQGIGELFAELEDE